MAEQSSVGWSPASLNLCSGATSLSPSLALSFPSVAEELNRAFPEYRGQAVRGHHISWESTGLGVTGSRVQSSL